MTQRNDPPLSEILPKRGAQACGILGTLFGGLMGTLVAVPGSIAAIGYNLGGNVGALLGLAAGILTNLIPVYKNRDEDIIRHSPHASQTQETVQVYHLMGDAGAIVGKLVGTFTGAALGMVLAEVVSLTETRKEKLDDLAEGFIKKRSDDKKDPHP